MTAAIIQSTGDIIIHLQKLFSHMKILENNLELNDIFKLNKELMWIKLSQEIYAKFSSFMS